MRAYSRGNRHAHEGVAASASLCEEVLRHYALSLGSWWGLLSPVLTFWRGVEWVCCWPGPAKEERRGQSLLRVESLGCRQYWGERPFAARRAEVVAEVVAERKSRA